MKKKIGIAFLLVFVVAIISVTFYTQYYERVEAASKEISIEEIAVPLNQLDIHEIVKLEVKDDKEALVLENKEGKWVSLDHEKVTYDDILINDLLSYLDEVHSLSIIRNVENLEDYGITSGSRMITLYDTKNMSQTFRLGMNDKDHLYISSDETELIYVVEEGVAELLATPVGELIDTHIDLPKREKLTSIEILEAGQNTIALENRMNETIKQSIWYLKEYYEADYQVIDESINGILDSIESLKKTSFIGKRTSEQDYGLAKPSLVLKINEETVFTFGDRVDGYIYFTIGEDNLVFTMDETLIKTLQGIKTIDLIRKEVCLEPIGNIAKVTLDNPQVTYELIVDMSQEEGVGTLDEIVLDAAQTQELITLIQEGIWIEAPLQNPQIEQKEERKADITVIYTFKDESEMLIELIPYDINYYILRVDGMTQFAVNKEKVISLFSNLEEVKKEAK